MGFVFAWNDWNSAHVTNYGSNAASAEYVVSHAEYPFPREIGDGKFLVWGRTATGDFLEVIFAFRIPEELEFADLSFSIGPLSSTTRGRLQFTSAMQCR